MHQRYLVLFNKADAKNSEEARNHVREYLDENGFVGEGGRFSGGIADWYVVGGRWSGELTEALLDQDTLKKFNAEVEKQGLGWTSAEKTEAMQRKAAHALFRKFFPKFKGEIPIYRDTYRIEGYEDDAMIVTKAHWEQLLKGEVNLGDTESFCFIDDDVSRLTEKNTVGKYWLVVVDYHS